MLDIYNVIIVDTGHVKKRKLIYIANLVDLHRSLLGYRIRYRRFRLHRSLLGHRIRYRHFRLCGGHWFRNRLRCDVLWGWDVG